VGPSPLASRHDRPPGDAGASIPWIHPKLAATTCTVLLRSREHARRSCAAIACAFAATACDTTIVTERDQVSADAEMSVSLFFSGDPVLVGTQICPTLDRVRVSEGLRGEWADHDDSEIRACYGESLRGPVSFDEDGCLSLDAPGEAVWELQRRACDLEGSFGDDLVRFDVVDIAQVRGAFAEAPPRSPACWQGSGSRSGSSKIGSRQCMPRS
jgi:hypothetical protein